MNTGRRFVAIVALGAALACVTATAQVRPQFDLADVHAAMNRNAVPRGRFKGMWCATACTGFKRPWRI